MTAASNVAVPVSTTIRVERVAPVVLFAVVTLVALLTVTPWPVGAFQDDAIYVVLAKALANGEGYRMLSLPGSPHGTHYPPGYPFFLSLLWRIWPSFPDNIVFFKFANAVWLSLAALGAYAFAQTRLRWTALPAAGAAAAGTLAIVVLLVTGVVLSEPMFMALLFPALLSCERAAETGSVRTAVAAGLWCGGLALVRTLGAVIIPAALLFMLWRRHFRAATALVIAAAICLVPWQLWLNAYQHEIPPVLMGKYGAYGPWVAEGVADGGRSFVQSVVLANVATVDQFINYAFMPVSSGWARAAAFITVCGLVVTGLLVFARRSPVSACFLAGYTIVILLWPFEPNRFIIAVWPLFTLCGLSGALAIWRKAPRSVPGRGVRMASLGLVAAVILGALAYNARGYTNKWWVTVQRDAGRRAKPIVEWVATSTAPDDVLMTDDDLLVYLYTERRAMPTSTFHPWERLRQPTDQDNIAAVRTMIETYSPRFYITTSAPGQRAAEALTQGDRPVLRRHRLIPNAFIYERIAP